jgi:fatty acyl-CoA reductase
MDSAASLGVLLVVSLGIIRVVASEEGPKAEFVPVDLVASALIACAWDIPYQDPIPIYNYISSTDNPTSVHDFFHSFKTQISRYPLSKAMWTPRLTIATSQIWHTILKVLYHYIPSLLVDLLSVITLKKPQMFVKSRKYERAIDLSYSFVNKYRTFSNRNVKNLCDKMNDSDRELFPCDVRLINWDRQNNGFQKGARIYLFNDPLSTLPEAKAKMHK